MMSILHEAHGLVHGDRGHDYGAPLDNFTHTADLWTAYLSDKLNVPLEAEDVAALMVLVKMSRQRHAPKRDNVVDIAGYAETWQMTIDERKRRGALPVDWGKRMADEFCSTPGK